MIVEIRNFVGNLHGDVRDRAAGSTADGAAQLRQTLTAALQEHEYLAGIAVAQAVVTKKTDSPEFTAAAAALDKNSVALSDAIGSIYGKAAGDAFLPLWRKHIGFYVDYTVGKLTNDTSRPPRPRPTSMATGPTLALCSTRSIPTCRRPPSPRRSSPT